LMLTDCMSRTPDAEPAPDPYRYLPEPSEANDPCLTGEPVGNTYSAGRHCGNLTVNDAKDFAPGVHVIDGGELRFNANAIVTAPGVMFYLTNGANVTMNGGATLHITAPTTGTYHGIAFFGDRTQADADQTFNGNSTSYITGALYYPTQTVRFLGNFSGQNDCMQVVASIIEYTGSATFDTDCAGTGVYQIPTPGVVSLAE
jgi:hypothetical protein